MEPSSGSIRAPAPRERIFNAPLAPVLLAASMPALFFFQQRLPDGGASLAFAPADLGDGRWLGVFTSMLLHAGWGHALMNAGGALVFGTPVARLLYGARGVVAFLVFYIVSGVIAALGYALVHPGSQELLVGASGAVFGLIGAAMRLLGGGGRTLSLTDRRVVTASLAWMGVNAATGLIGFAPGAEGARIAWEAHVFGYLFGLIAIGPLALRFPPRAAPLVERFDSPDRLGDPET